MSRCVKCQQPFPAHQPPPSFCPRCGAERIADDDQDRWTSIARLTDLAEVGYFSDVLESEGFTPRVRQHNEFSAVDGSWKTIFIVQVPPQQSGEAAQHLRLALEQTTDEADQAGDDRALSGEASSGEKSANPWASLWKPVVFVLIASGVVYSMRHVDRGPRQPPRPGTSLWDTLIETDQVFASDSGNQHPNRRLVADRRTRTIWLYEDINGDGRADRVRGYREGRLVRELAR
jgi:hypothetical protein